MKKTRFTEEQITRILAEVEAGGMNITDARRLKELEAENNKLKRIVADQALDIVMLKDVNSKKW